MALLQQSVSDQPLDQPTARHSLDIRLAGDWLVVAAPLPLAAETALESLDFEAGILIPDSCHLQTALHPDQLYWGKHLREINQKAWFFRRQFYVPDQDFERARLRFDGVDYYAAVWLNGEFIGTHEGSFAPFTFDVTAALRANAENTLIVRVTSPWDAPNLNGIFPTDHVIRGMVKGLYEHGEGVIPPDVNPLGIWQPVWLLLDDGISLDRLWIQADTTGEAQISLAVNNASTRTWRGTISLNIAAENHDGRGTSALVPITVCPGEQTITHIVQIADPRLWWSWDQGLPNLYRLCAQLRTEDGSPAPYSTISSTFGLREIKLDRSPQQFTYQLNGRSVFLRGTSYIPDLYLSQCSTETLRRDLDLVRDLNLNALRVHVHIAPATLYDLCDHLGIMIWQDFELSWIHENSLDFERRAAVVQREMLDLLGNHPSIITWSCHNEPTMVYSQRANLEQHPDPLLYEEVRRCDPSRPVFICSGQLEADWRRSGDTHSYYGAIWTARYTDVYSQRYRLATEFGFEAPAAVSTLQSFAECWQRLGHLEEQIDHLWTYQAQLIQYHVEHFRRQRAQSCGGYLHFMLNDLAPQVGCGIVDVLRQPKGGYRALQLASQPLHVALEYDHRRAYALWIFNDLDATISNGTLLCRVYDRANQLMIEKLLSVDVSANCSQRVTTLEWSISADDCWRVELELQDELGVIVARNIYDRPLQPLQRPRGYPWKFDMYLGCKVFDLPGASSLAEQTGGVLMKLIPLAWREKLGEWSLRQHFPPALLSIIARIAALLMPPTAPRRADRRS
ncbi:MAG: beta galactosidase jelly roll domain-containing protein [Anaerolineae bacterium]|nr:beta galactosidase jelly roll domain-containing protein [Anaerolineae bacterium]